MSLFSSVKLNSLEDLLVHELQDLYDAEQRIIDALPRMADAANSQEVRGAFMEHLDTTRQQLSRLEECFGLLGKDVESVTCDGIKGIISEGETVIDAKGDPDVKDAALICAAQKVEHYEISAYGSARTFAHRCGRDDVANLLDMTVKEEGNTDHRLTSIAESMVNPRAEHKW